MQFESDSLRLTGIKLGGGEEFDTGKPEPLIAIFDAEYVTVTVGDVVVESRSPALTACRSSDVAAHGLIKNGVIRRRADNARYSIKRFEPDGRGMTVVILAEA